MKMVRSSNVSFLNDGCLRLQKHLNFICFYHDGNTNYDKSEISLVGTYRSVSVILVWEETGVLVKTHLTDLVTTNLITCRFGDRTYAASRTALRFQRVVGTVSSYMFKPCRFYFFFFFSFEIYM